AVPDRSANSSTTIGKMRVGLEVIGAVKASARSHALAGDIPALAASSALWLDLFNALICLCKVTKSMRFQKFGPSWCPEIQPRIIWQANCSVASKVLDAIDYAMGSETSNMTCYAKSFKARACLSNRIVSCGHSSSLVSLAANVAVKAILPGESASRTRPPCCPCKQPKRRDNWR